MKYRPALKRNAYFIHLLFIVWFQIYLVFGSSAQAQENEHSCILTQRNSEADLTNDKLKITEIVVRVKPIFDNPEPGFLGWVYETANRLHINTREKVVRKDLLFQVGDSLQLDQLAATERRLRGRRYYSDARVMLDPACEDGARIIVEVKEVWTLEPTLQFSKSSENASFGFGLEETNFLGLGTTIAVARFSDDFREGTLIKYTDPNTGFYQSEFDLRLANNDDGYSRQLRLNKPFLALETQYAGGISLLAIEQDDTLYQQTLEIDRYQRETESVGLFFGSIMGAVTQNSVSRWLVGYEWQTNKYNNALNTQNDSFVPRDTQISYPWLELQWLEHEFVEMTNLEEMNRIEDINLGLESFVRLGWSDSSENNLNSRLFLRVGLSQYLRLGKPHTFKWSGLFDGLVDVDNLSDVRDGLMGFSFSYFWRPAFFSGRSQSFMHVSDTRVLQPEGNRFLQIGGVNGARGYPSRFFFGDRRQVITLEQRFFGKKEYYSLFYLGSAVFFDAAKVWGENATGLPNNNWLQSAGFGLRISTNRLGGSDGGGNSTMHIDYAVPVNPALVVDDSQFLITVKKSF